MFTQSRLFLLVFFSLLFSVWLLRDLIIYLTPQPLSTLTQAPNNLKNKLFNLPAGNFFFQVTSASTIQGPVFLEGEINPPDVHIGDIQHLKIIVQSPSGIKSVTTRIETDNSEDIVELTHIGNISFKDMQSEKYLVDANGKLKILKGSEIALRHWIKIANEKLATAFSAKAASGDDKEMWEGSWTVHDTHDAIYHTTFIAEDNDGLTNSLTIAWSDACEIPPNGDWTLGQSGYKYDCTISSTDGVENGDITIESNNLVINAPFAFNPGYQININGGSIIIGTGQIKKTYLWICDKDGDGYTSGSTMGTVYAQDNAPQCGGKGGSGTGFYNLYQKLVHYLEPKKAMALPTCGSTTPVYTIRRYNFKGTNDCYNDSSNAYPNSTNLCADNRGDGSWDYNCDSIQEKELTQIGSCNTQYPLNCHDNCSYILIPGWKDTVATCGTSSEWLVNCTNTGTCITPDCSTACPLGKYTCENSNGINEIKTQKCR